MRPPRRRIDNTQRDIVAALRAAGASVAVTSHVGQGFPDLVVGWGRRLVLLVECKSPGGELTLDERRFFEHWHGPPIQVVRSAEEALSVLEIERMRTA